jgi:O-antigen/teichoic acid export membrane protein
LSSGRLVILQGLRKLQYLAQASIIGSLSGLIIAVPMYYFIGIKAIVPAIIINTFAGLIIAVYFSSKVKTQSVQVDLSSTFTISKKMLVMGFFINLSYFITLGSTYIIRLIISNMEEVGEVGLYNAGSTIITTLCWLNILGNGN